MDDQSLAPHEHFEALAGIERLNKFSFSVSIVWQALQSLNVGDRPLRVLDIATGGGDIPIELFKRAQAKGYKWEFYGCDKSAVAIEFAGRKADSNDADVQFFQADALHEIAEDYDVTMTSLFTHHLDPPEVIRLIQLMKQRSKIMLLINDLERSASNYISVWLATRLLSNSRVVHHDGPVSVRAAFTCNEFAQMARKAGLIGFEIAPKFPCRLLLSYRTD